jgi:hypothetical protein
MITNSTAAATVVETPAAGFALVNGTPDILDVPVPAGANGHGFTVAGSLDVSSAETGGQIALIYTSGGQAIVQLLDAGGHGAGTNLSVPNPGSVVTGFADAGTTIRVTQNSALTLGAAVLRLAVILF